MNACMCTHLWLFRVSVPYLEYKVLHPSTRSISNVRFRILTKYLPQIIQFASWESLDSNSVCVTSHAAAVCIKLSFESFEHSQWLEPLLCLLNLTLLKQVLFLPPLELVCTRRSVSVPWIDALSQHVLVLKVLLFFYLILLPGTLEK